MPLPVMQRCKDLMRVLFLVTLIPVFMHLSIGFAEDSESKTHKESEPKREIYSGKVVLAQEALKKRGIKVADEMKSQAVLELESGELLPIAADWRGRAFYQDERLRHRKVELVGYRRPGIPYLQVLNVFTFNDKNERQDTDYWCDICSIPMYEIKECECCQGPIRLRFRSEEHTSELQSH